MKRTAEQKKVFESLPSEDRKLGQILVNMNVLTIEQLSQALAAQEVQKSKGQPPMKLGLLLLFSNMITKEQLEGALRKQTGKAKDSRDMVMKARRKELENKRDAEAIETSGKSDSWVSSIFSVFKKKSND